MYMYVFEICIYSFIYYLFICIYLIICLVIDLFIYFCYGLLMFLIDTMNKFSNDFLDG